MSKVWEKIVLILLYTLYKAGVINFPFIPDCFFFFSIAASLFIHSANRFVLKKKNVYVLLVFFNWVPYMQLSQMIRGLNQIVRKGSVASINKAEGGLGVFRGLTSPRRCCITWFFQLKQISQSGKDMFFILCFLSY